MLMNHKNFHFTQIPDRAEKFSSVTHNYIWAPNVILRLRKKLMSQSQENLRTGRKMDGRMDRQTILDRTLQAQVGGSINKLCIDSIN